jgi:hypothetical protein
LYNQCLTCMPTPPQQTAGATTSVDKWVGQLISPLWRSDLLTSPQLCATCRNQAILLDSDSDGIDSEDEGSVVHSTDSEDGDLPAAPTGAAADGFSAERSTASATQSGSRSKPPGPTDEGTAAGKKQLQKRASSKRVRKPASGPTASQQQADNGLIKASYPTTLESLTSAKPAVGAAAAAGVQLQKGASRRFVPIALQYKGPILSDSDSDDEGLPAAMADKSGLLGRGHVDSAAAVPSTLAAAAAPGQPVAAAAAAAATAAGAAPAPVLPVLPRPVVLVAPPSRGKAAAVRQAVAGAAQAAGRAMAAAQAGSSTAAARQAGIAVVVPPDTGRASSPIVLTPPRRSAFTAGAAGSPRSEAAVPAAPSAAAAAVWEPAFPGAAAAEEQEQKLGSRAEGGWSNVAL